MEKGNGGGGNVIVTEVREWAWNQLTDRGALSEALPCAGRLIFLRKVKPLSAVEAGVEVGKEAGGKSSVVLVASMTS